MTSQFLSWFFAELMFVTLVFVSINFTKKPKSRRSHKEALQAFSSRGSSPFGATPFEENKRRYLEAIKNGKYRSKDLACKDLYDLDQEFYQCLESVYFD